MSKKKTDNTAYLRHQRLMLAGQIKDRYPQVKTLAFEMNYRDPDGLEKLFQKTYTWTPENYAFFEQECPFGSVPMEIMI